MEFKDYYQTLGVSPTATADEIKKAYRKLARKYHPDVSKEPDAVARMTAVNEANAVLSDPEKRAAYDRLAQEPRMQPGQDFRPPRTGMRGSSFRTERAPMAAQMALQATTATFLNNCLAAPPGRVARGAANTPAEDSPHPARRRPPRPHRAGPGRRLPGRRTHPHAAKRPPGR